MIIQCEAVAPVIVLDYFDTETWPKARKPHWRYDWTMVIADLNLLPQGNQLKVYPCQIKAPIIQCDAVDAKFPLSIAIEPHLKHAHIAAASV